MPIEIRETTVIPGKDGDIVQIRISDAARDDEAAASFVLSLHAKLRPPKTPLLAQLQRDAMTMAQDAMTPILQSLEQQIQSLRRT